MNRPSLFRVSTRGWHLVASSWARLVALAGAAGVAAAGLSLFYASQIEPRWLDFKTHKTRLPGLSPAFEGYRLIQISDLHLARRKLLTPDRLEGILHQINDLRPDAIVITGDFVSRLDATSREGIARLSLLHAPDGVYAIPGNHDYWCNWPAVAATVEGAGVRVLCNEHVVIRRKGAPLVIAGVDNIWEGQPDLDQALYGISNGTPVILLAHEPNYADIAAYDGRVALQLSGHSHGGQIRVPMAGPLALPDIAWMYPMGIYRIGNMQLYVNRGLGLAELPLRFYCRPEITTFILSPENSRSHLAPASRSRL
jgi:uncharacterized protein